MTLPPPNSVSPTYRKQLACDIAHSKMPPSRLLLKHRVGTTKVWETLESRSSRFRFERVFVVLAPFGSLIHIVESVP